MSRRTKSLSDIVLGAGAGRVGWNVASKGATAEAPPRCLLIASSGGHLAELEALLEHEPISETSLWVTFPGPQADELAERGRVFCLPYVGPRDWAGTFRSFRPIAALMRREKFDRVVSSGAAIAVPALSMARLRRIPAFYVESFTRTESPSMTGRICALIPSVRVLTQHDSGEQGKWERVTSVFESVTAPHFRRLPRERERTSILVLLGTVRTHRFDALVEAVDQLITAHCKSVVGGEVQVTWQLGCTSRVDVSGEAHTELPPTRIAELARRADVVFTHAGVGLCLQLARAGVKPIIVPRRQFRKEHVDDHQLVVAEAMARRRLGVTIEADALPQHSLLSLIALLDEASHEE